MAPHKRRSDDLLFLLMEVHESLEKFSEKLLPILRAATGPQFHVRKKCSCGKKLKDSVQESGSENESATDAAEERKRVSSKMRKAFTHCNKRQKGVPVLLPPSKSRPLPFANGIKTHDTESESESDFETELKSVNGNAEPKSGSAREGGETS